MVCVPRPTICPVNPTFPALSTSMDSSSTSFCGEPLAATTEVNAGRLALPDTRARHGGSVCPPPVPPAPLEVDVPVDELEPPETLGAHPRSANAVTTPEQTALTSKRIRERR